MWAVPFGAFDQDSDELFAGEYGEFAWEDELGRVVGPEHGVGGGMAVHEGVDIGALFAVNAHGVEMAVAGLEGGDVFGVGIVGGFGGPPGWRGFAVEEIENGAGLVGGKFRVGS